ncbi:MAG: hypothetical protein GQ581_01900 [Methyloprofundus sp.]|nr:hypothetical protein [Methyloprofundus sp.]
MSEIFKFDVSGFEIKGNTIARTVEGVAYSGKPILNHPHWGNVIFDLNSTQSKQVIPLLLQHNSGKIAGYTEAVSIDDAIRFKGSLLQTTESGREIAQLCDEGFPWQMSVHIQPDYTTDVNSEHINGHLFSGVVFKNSVIREISFCPVGADGNTSANVFNQDSNNYLSDLMSQTIDQQQAEQLHARGIMK